MGAATFLRALTLLILTASAFSDQHFLVIFPAFIHHPSTEKLCIFLDSFSKSIHVSVTLEMKLQNHTLLEKDVNAPGTFECTSFQVPKFVPRNKDFGFQYEEEVAHVHVLIQHDKSTFENRKKVLVKNAYKRTLIELDKPFYKPGEEVKFRIVTLDEKFQTIEEAIPMIKLEIDKTGYASFIVKTTDIKLSQKEYINTIVLYAEIEEEGTGEEQRRPYGKCYDAIKIGLYFVAQSSSAFLDWSLRLIVI
ncbi:PREDICTED: pregnancy zone protein-like [Thamnophis sirtalis]|uniref:Pregnancy zone protein-like n=1 Tax=Thamnophis sirtalis TaxID=35019 RepID=A0A6I9XQK8_9SAUR|nr:PREDICTED: pregnancy zone protein-like [Thamnophis sirtalis]